MQGEGPTEGVNLESESLPAQEGHLKGPFDPKEGWKFHSGPGRSELREVTGKECNRKYKVGFC